MGNDDNLLHQTPCHVSLAIDTVFRNGLGHRRDVASEVLDPEIIFEDLFRRQVILSLDTRPIFGHVDLGSTVSVTQPLHQFPESRCVRTQPGTLGHWTDAVAILVFEEHLEVSTDILWIRRCVLVLDVVGTIMIHAVEVVGASDEFPLFFCELR